MCLLRSLHTGQEATVRAGHETTDWFGIGKGIHQGCMLSPCFFNLYAEYIMRNTGLDEAQLESRLPREISVSSVCRWAQPYDNKWRRTKEPLDKREKGEWKSWVKAQHSENEDHGIQSHHFLVNRWGNSGNSGRLYLGGPKITADVDCSHKIKRRLLLGRKVMTNLAY